ILDEVARAADEGIGVSRGEVRAMLAHHGDSGQLALWSLLAPANGRRGDGLDAAREALGGALRLVGAAGGQDPKAEALATLLAGPMKGAKTIVFTEFRDTAIHLMRSLRHRLRCITVVGDRAWAGTTPLTRAEALDGFAPASRSRAPDP